MIVQAGKRCTKCGEQKPFDGFFKNSAGRCGRHSQCKACMALHKSASIVRMRERGEERVPDRKHCAMCGECLPAERFCRHANTGDGLRPYCRQCDRVVRRSNKYGLTRATVLRMLKKTRCDACGKPLLSSAEKHFDHRHSDGAVRGVLCEPCNTTLGKCCENTAILMALCDYLTRTQGVDYRRQPSL